jgi:hypothetical protein
MDAIHDVWDEGRDGSQDDIFKRKSFLNVNHL